MLLLYRETDLLSAATLRALWSAVPISWQWQWRVLKAIGLLAHLGSVFKHTWATVPAHFAELAGPPVMPHASSSRAAGSGQQEGSWSVRRCASEWCWGAARWKRAWESDPRSQKLAPRSESSALERTLVNFCHADWQVFGSSLPGNRWICPEQNWKSWHFTCPAVSRWAKKSFRVNRRQRQLVISGPPSWCDSYQEVWEAPVLGLEGKILMKENLLGASY